jgi:branched-chain amino acid transport system ATP-binding protein
MLSVTAVSAFYGDLQALREVSFEVGEGEIVSVIGSNGAGKTTALKTISGILRPRAGIITFEGHEIYRTSTSLIVKQGISHVPEGRQLFPTMSVRENLELGAQFPHVKRLRKETMEQIFTFFPRLKERLSQKAGTLSGGEQQMVAIGRGLMSRPRLLMLDEPSLGLSPMLVATIFEIIRKINASGVSVLLVEQNVFHALGMSHRGYVLENGSMAMSGESAALLKDPHIRRTYLGL